jgi:hypothetical protein
MDIKERHASPAGDWIAIEFERGCGVGSPLNTQVSLIPQGLYFDPDRFPPFFVLNDRRKVSVRWTGDRALLIRFPKEASTRLKDSPANIDVRYESD